MPERSVTIQDYNRMPPETLVTSSLGNRWRKRRDNLWDALTDLGYGPHVAADLPRWATVQQPSSDGAE
jgi:hypothetical protein